MSARIKEHLDFLQDLGLARRLVRAQTAQQPKSSGHVLPHSLRRTRRPDAGHPPDASSPNVTDPSRMGKSRRSRHHARHVELAGSRPV